ncbi:T9SS type A sorting domain-containing protein [Flavitalea flava]
MRPVYLRSFCLLFIWLPATVMAPVTWLNFRATVGEGPIVLDWTVGMDQSTVRYEIQRSVDTVVYSTVGKVKGATGKLRPAIGSGTMLEMIPDSTDYSFTDFSPKANTLYYYRLLRVGKNKQTSYSPLVKAKSSDPDHKLNIYPNPANTIIHISNVGGSAMVRIYDQSGRSVLEIALEGEEQDINISTLQTGNYYVRVDREGRAQFKQVLMVN